MLSLPTSRSRISWYVDRGTGIAEAGANPHQGSCDIKFPIRLEGLASRHHMFSSYEPELFPGLIYRMIKPKIVLLIFVSGKIVLTGAKVREEIYQAFEMIYPVLQGMLCSHRILELQLMWSDFRKV